MENYLDKFITFPFTLQYAKSRESKLICEAEKWKQLDRI